VSKDAGGEASREAHAKMPLGDVGSSSFAQYEGIRILVPGALAVTLYAALTATYGLSLAAPASDALGGIVGALFAGLFLRFVDAPSRCVHYRNDALPDRELGRWGVGPGTYPSLTSVYFVMLDTSFPPTIRDRALYTGSMFRIAFESIYMLGFTSVTVLTLASATPNLGLDRGSVTSTRVVLLTTAVTHLLMVVAGARSQFRFRRNRMDRSDALSAVLSDFLHDLGGAGLIALLIAAYAAAPALDAHSGTATAIAVLAPGGLWAVLYFAGHANGPGGARSISPPATVLLYGSAAAIACACAAFRTSPQGTLDTRVALAWAGASLIPAVLMAFRAHERALIASFRTQATWMRVNRRRLIANYGLESDP
jgi:hypothetical protein